MVSCIVLLLSFKHDTVVTVTEISEIRENNVIIGNNKEINLNKVHYKSCINNGQKPRGQHKNSPETGKL